MVYLPDMFPTVSKDVGKACFSEKISLTSFVEKWSCNAWFPMEFCCHEWSCKEWSWKVFLQYFVLIGLEKHLFQCFWGVVMTAGLVKACFQWHVLYGPEKAYSLWLILVDFV